MVRSTPTLNDRSPGASLDCLHAVLSLVQEELGQLEATLASSDADQVSGLVRTFDAIGRAASAGWAVAARRAAELEVHSASGHRNAEDWLAQQSGISFAR